MRGVEDQRSNHFLHTLSDEISQDVAIHQTQTNVTTKHQANVLSDSYYQQFNDQASNNEPSTKTLVSITRTI